MSALPKYQIWVRTRCPSPNPANAHDSRSPSNREVVKKGYFPDSTDLPAFKKGRVDLGHNSLTVTCDCVDRTATQPLGQCN